MLHCVTGGKVQDRAQRYSVTKSHWLSPDFALCYVVLQSARTKSVPHSSMDSYLWSADVTLSYAVLQAERTKARRYSVSDSHLCNAVLHCVTGGEDQGTAL